MIAPSASIMPASSSIAPRGQRSATDDAKAHDACQQFEAYVFGMLLKEMRSAIPDNGLIPCTSGEKIFQESLDNAYAQQMSSTQQLGLAQQLYEQLQRHTSQQHGQRVSEDVEKKLEFFC